MGSRLEWRAAKVPTPQPVIRDHRGRCCMDGSWVDSVPQPMSVDRTKGGRRTDQLTCPWPAQESTPRDEAGEHREPPKDGGGVVHRFGGMKARHDGTLTGGPAQRCAKQTSETWTGMLGAPTSGIEAAAAAIACMGRNPWHGMAASWGLEPLPMPSG